jgi:predicted SprT family Zn-dependent metalloprotease
VPRHAIEGIVFHEMLHIAIPPYKRSGKNVIHGPEFRKAERGFPHFNAWRKWEKEHLKSIND